MKEEYLANASGNKKYEYKLDKAQFEMSDDENDDEDDGIMSKLKKVSFVCLTLIS